MLRVAVVVCIGFVLLAAPAIVSNLAYAAPPGASGAALNKFNEATRAFHDGQYAQAVEAYQASLDLERSPNTRFMMAKCYLALHKLGSAYIQFRRAAQEAQDRLQTTKEQRYAATRNAALAEAAAIESKVPRLTVAVPSDVPEGFQLTLDGNELPRAAWGVELEVDPGPHTIVAEGARLERVEQTLNLPVASRQRFAVPLRRAATAVVRLTLLIKPAGLAASIDDRPISPNRIESQQALDPGVHRVVVTAPGYARFVWQRELSDGDVTTIPVKLQAGGVPRWAFFSVAGTALAAAIIGSGLAGQAVSADGNERAKPIVERTTEARDSIRTNLTVGEAFLGIAGVLGATAIILATVTQWRGGEQPKETPPRRAVRFIPWFGAKQTGISLLGDF